MSDILITANNISKIYDQDILLKRGANFYALRNVDFILEEGDFISVMGPSGSGKSTLLNCLSTLDEVSSGAVKIFNRFVGEMNDAELSDYRNRYLGFIFQNHNLVPSLSVFDNIATPLILNEVSPQEIKERVNEIGERLNISHTLYKKPNECSGGERQRVAIARAIVTKPKIVVCDEPTGNLDSKNSHEVLEILRELNQQGTSIILVTHDNMIASYAKRFLYLRDGQIINRIDCQNGSQVDFFNEIVKITTQDSLLKLFNPQNNLKKESKKEFQEREIKNSVGEKTEARKNENTTSQVKVETFEPKKSTTARLIVYAIFDGLEYDEASALRNRVLNFDKDAVRFNNTNYEEIEIPYGEIKSTKISMCSRSIISWPMPEFRFYLDLDIITKDNNICRFEVLNQRNALSLFDTLENHQIVMEDPYGIVTLYRSKPDDLVRHRYLLYNFKKIAKEYNLDNPRNL